MTAEARAPMLVALLPAFQGGDQLAGALLAQMPNCFNLGVVKYPSHVHTYEALLPFVTEQLSRAGPATLLAESFAGPLAIKYAAENPQGVRGMVLSASFILPPRSRALRFLPLRLLFTIARPRAAIRFALTNGIDDRKLVEEIYRVGQALSPELMAARVRTMLSADSTRELSRYSGPLLYLLAKRDRLVSQRSLGEIQLLRPDVQVAEIDAPHLILQTRPAEAWAEIERFTSRIKLDSPPD